MDDIDRKVHELMGRCWCENATDNPLSRCRHCKQAVSYHPKYSSEIGDAFEVVEFLRTQKHQTFMDNETGKWAVEIYPLGDFPAIEIRGADSLPLAICQAALMIQEKP